MAIRFGIQTERITSIHIVLKPPTPLPFSGSNNRSRKSSYRHYKTQIRVARGKSEQQGEAGAARKETFLHVHREPSSDMQGRLISKARSGNPAFNKTNDKEGERFRRQGVETKPSMKPKIEKVKRIGGKLWKPSIQ